MKKIIAKKENHIWYIFLHTIYTYDRNDLLKYMYASLKSYLHIVC